MHCWNSAGESVNLVGNDVSQMSRRGVRNAVRSQLARWALWASNPQNRSNTV